MRVVILTEGGRAGDFDPLCVNRPPCLLLSGLYTFVERWRRVLIPDRIIILTRPELADAVAEASGCLTNAAVPLEADDVWVLDGATWPNYDRRWSTLSFADEFVWRDGNDGVVHSARISGSRWHGEPLFARWAAGGGSGPIPEVAGVSVESPALHVPWHLWDLVASNARHIVDDVALAMNLDGTPADIAESAVMMRRESVYPGSDVVIGPHVVLDATGGPIVIGDRATIEPFSRIEGPFALGPDSVVTGGKVSGGSSFGPASKIGGEIEASIGLGFCSKVHDGFFGHGYIGEWVNLGAMTTTSDLKNTYGTVRVELASGPCETGSLKVGSFIADHTKTGIGTLLPTGCVLGLGVNYFAGGMLAPKRVPPFVWGGPGAYAEFRLERMLEIAATVKSRRAGALERAGRPTELTAAERSVLESAFAQSRDERQHFLDASRN